MAPLRMAECPAIRNGVVLLAIGSLVLAGCGVVVARGNVRAPTSVSHPPAVRVEVLVGSRKTAAVNASPVVVQYDRSRLISKTFNNRTPAILQVSTPGTRLEVSAPDVPQFVQIESAKSITKNGTPIGKSVIGKCGPNSPLDLFSHCTRGHESNGRWKWNIAMPSIHPNSPYLVIYVRWVTSRSTGPSVIYLGVWNLLLRRAVTY